jgi:hypothetical protein
MAVLGVAARVRSHGGGGAEGRGSPEWRRGSCAVRASNAQARCGAVLAGPTCRHGPSMDDDAAACELTFLKGV